MPTSTDIESQSSIQRWVLGVVSTFFLFSLAVYFLKFHGELSPKQEVWGQFGDFMGGAINPIVGLCTVWLLTVSLQQNQLALRQAHAELILATRALEESSAMQGKTEAALKQQIDIADQTRDMANASALCNHFYTSAMKMTENIKLHSRGWNEEEQQSRNSRLFALGMKAKRLEKILEKEASRLIERYDSDNTLDPSGD